MEDQIVNKILDISKDLSNFLNDNLLLEFAKLHGINSKEYCHLNLKQEVVAKRSLFFNQKKKYALHIINREGIPRDEYELRGIVLRRSDFPSYTKECIQKIIDMLLKTEKVSFKEIWKYISEVEIEMRQRIISGDKSIAKPVSIKSDDDYKKIPTHVLGANLWNSLEYEYFVPGTKGYLFKIKDIDLFECPDKVVKNASCFTEKNNNIVLPFEENYLPSYYIPDIDSMLDFCWTNRWKELLDPVMSDMIKFK